MKGIIKFCLKAIVLLLILGMVAILAVDVLKGEEYVRNVLWNITGGRIDSWEESLASREEGMEDWSDRLNGLKDLAGQVLENYNSFEGYDIEEADLFEKEFPVESGNVEHTFEAATVVGLDVELGGCQLEITEASQNLITVETENIGKFQAYLEDGKLHIRATRKAKEDASGCSIKLYLPVGYHYQEMELAVGAGQILADHLNAIKVHLEVGAGQIVANSVSADELELSVGAGDIGLKQMTTRLLEADVDAGRLQAIGQVSGNIEGECAVGSLELNLSGSLKDYNYLLDCAAGNIYLDSEKYSSAIGQERKLDHGANRTMDLDCAVGNIRIAFGKEE